MRLRPWHAVDGGDLETATSNIRAFVEEAVPGSAIARNAKHDYDAEDDDGRFAFILRLGKRKCEIQMPGLPLEQVRYTGMGGQNAWNFPRLYVDGDSWLWFLAVRNARRALGLPVPSLEEEPWYDHPSEDEPEPAAVPDGSPGPRAWEGLPFLTFSLDEPLPSEVDTACKSPPQAQTFYGRYLVVESPPHEWGMQDVLVGTHSQFAGGVGGRPCWAFTPAVACAI